MISICDNCLFNVKLESIRVCKLKKLHKAKISDIKSECKDYIKYERGEKNA